jgi:hypothetical protein
MFDTKPDALGGIGGEFKPAPTSASGIQICELLPRTARTMHHSASSAACTTTVSQNLPMYTG